MKNPSFLRELTGNTLGILVVGGFSLLPAAAQEITKSQISQNQADEQAVRSHTSAVVTQVQSLIDELAANGISGDDIKVLNATKAALTNLSGPEMDRVIASLKKAGEASSAATSQQNVVNAYAGQKGIILQFRQILKDYEQRQAAYELPVRFKELAGRQTETMLTSASVARATAGKSASELTSMQQTTQQIVQADQEAIGNEVALAQDQLAKAAAGSTADDAKTMAKAQADMKSGKLQQALQDANDALKAGQMLKALKAQAIARDELKHIAQDLNPPTNAVDSLTANAANLAKLIDEQKGLLDQTNAASNVKPRVTGLDEKQGAIVDEANSLQQDMQGMSATAAGLVKEAINPMQLSRSALGQQWGGPDSFTKAAVNEQAAIDKLTEAQKQLTQDLADAKKAADDASKDPVAKLQDLQNKVQAALQQQQQVTNQTAQTLNNNNATPPPDTTQLQQQQNQLQQQADNLQKDAQPLSLDASQALAQAASDMKQAQQDLTDPTKAADAQAAQQAAQADLAKAGQQINQQIAQAQQTPPDPAALAAAADSLQQAQSSVSSAIADTAPPPAGAAGATPPPPSMAAAASALAAAAKDTQAAAGTAGLPNTAAAAVQQAQAAIAQGQQAAAKGDASGTASAANSAEQALAQAQASVAMAQAGMAASSPSMAGGPPMPGGPDGPPGPPMPGQGKPGSQSAQSITGGSTDKGTLHDASGSGKFVTVASRDRAAIDQTQSEKRPQEYAPMIDQYMKNLADQSTASP